MRLFLLSGSRGSPRRKVIAATFAIAVLATVPHAAAAQPVPTIVPPWWDATFVANERACGGAGRPAWCAQWIEALDADLRPFGRDQGAAGPDPHRTRSRRWRPCAQDDRRGGGRLIRPSPPTVTRAKDDDR